jgi:predicted nucleotidyltransferase component of viral defense system
MDANAAKKLSAQLQISRDYILRESYEMSLLNDLFAGPFGADIVFKGGTALRLAYGSPRYSEDLDFDAIHEIAGDRFLDFVKQVGKRYPAVTEVETADKHNTLFALVRIAEPWLERAFSIKVEVSKRNRPWVKDQDYSPKLIVSEVSPLRVLAQVASLERIRTEKADALRNRKAARDVFDWWFIHQLLKREVRVDFTGFDKEIARSELRRLLPHHYWPFVESWFA